VRVDVQVGVRRREVRRRKRLAPGAVLVRRRRAQQRGVVGVSLAVDPHLDAIDVGRIANGAVDGVVRLCRNVLIVGRVQNRDDRRPTRSRRDWCGRRRWRWRSCTRAATVWLYVLF